MSEFCQYKETKLGRLARRIADSQFGTTMGMLTISQDSTWGNLPADKVRDRYDDLINQRVNPCKTCTGTEPCPFYSRLKTRGQT